MCAAECMLIPTTTLTHTLADKGSSAIVYWSLSHGTILIHTSGCSMLNLNAS